MVNVISFLKFGYSPTHNILDYLTGINNVNDVNPKFYATKEYLAMPIYNGIPLGSLSSTTAYIDYNGMTYSGGSFSLPVNKILPKCSQKLRNDLAEIENNFYFSNVHYTLLIDIEKKINKIDYYIDVLKEEINANSVDKLNRRLRKIQNNIIVVEYKFMYLLSIISRNL